MQHLYVSNRYLTQFFSGWNDETSQPPQQQQQPPPLQPQQQLQPPPSLIQMKSPPPTSQPPPLLNPNGPRPLMSARPNFATDRPPFMPPQQFNNLMITSQPPPKVSHNLLNILRHSRLTLLILHVHICRNSGSRRRHKTENFTTTKRRHVRPPGSVPKVSTFV